MADDQVYQRNDAGSLPSSDGVVVPDTAADDVAQSRPEPWLRGTHTRVPPLLRAVLHALLLADEDTLRWTAGLSLEEMETAPHGLTPVAFQLRHIARSLDRLLTYAEGRQLTPEQTAQLRSEHDHSDTAEGLREELEAAIATAMRRVLAFRPEQFDEARSVGRKRLPSNVAGLLVHVAEHTQRHVGQVVTTAKLLHSLRSTQRS